MDSELERKVNNLRSLNLTPKQIARNLGLKPSEVTSIIQSQARQSSLALNATGALAPIAKCLANKTCVGQLLQPRDRNIDSNFGGLGLVLVSRSVSNRFQVCTYLVDYWCLGVKDVIGPRQMDRAKYDKFVRTVYDSYSEGYEEITLQQAQDIIFGSIEYASQLGLKPHADFAQARDHLGEWSVKTDLKFGRDGSPFFIAGPYDNASKIVRTIEQATGARNFDFLAPLDD
jgi:hypothetical protein